jgi:hypothetical protein
MAAAVSSNPPIMNSLATVPGGNQLVQVPGMADFLGNNANVGAMLMNNPSMVSKLVANPAMLNELMQTPANASLLLTTQNYAQGGGKGGGGGGGGRGGGGGGKGGNRGDGGRGNGRGRNEGRGGGGDRDYNLYPRRYYYNNDFYDYDGYGNYYNNNGYLLNPIYYGYCLYKLYGAEGQVIACSNVPLPGYVYTGY